MTELPSDTKPKRKRRRPPEGRTTLLTLNDLDGRTNAARTARAMIAGIEADISGGDADSLSTAQRALAARAGVCAALLADMEVNWVAGNGMDATAYASLTNVLSRTLRTIGLHRVAKDVVGDLANYIRDRSANDDPAGAPRPPRPPRPDRKRKAPEPRPAPPY